MGEGKLFPGGPTCTYQGKQVPCFVRWSEKVGITSEILRECLAELDTRNVMPRVPGVIPFLLLDGHDSRFDLPFLKYILAENYEWCVCIGVPYGTSYWQLGDSSEKNGNYKIYLGVAKRKLVTSKADMGL